MFQLTPPADDVVPGAVAIGMTDVNYGSDFCALMSNGAIRCGYAGYEDSCLFYYDPPNHVDCVTTYSVDPDVFLGEVLTIVSGGSTNCALGRTAGVRCWDMTTANPPANDTLTGAISISVGHVHACALMATGGIECWGGNSVGQLGNGTTPDAVAPPNWVAETCPRLLQH